MFGSALNDSSKERKSSALLERSCMARLLALLASSSSPRLVPSAFRRPRLGRYSGRSPRRARSSSGGTPSRLIEGEELGEGTDV